MVKLGRLSSKEGLFYNFNYIFWKVKDYFGNFEKVKTQKTFNRTFWRKIMTDNIKFFERNPKAGKFRNGYNGADFSAAASCYLSSLLRMYRVYSNAQGSLVRNDGLSSACIKGHFQKDGFAFSSNSGIADNQTFFRTKFKFSHKYLESSNESFGQGVFRVGDKNWPSSFKGEKFFVDFISMMGMGNKPARDRCSCGLIDFIYSDKKPLSMKSFFNCFNFLRFHSIYLYKKISYFLMKVKVKMWKVNVFLY